MTPRERALLARIRSKGIEVKRPRRPDAGPIAADPGPKPKSPTPAEAETI